MRNRLFVVVAFITIAALSLTTTMANLPASTQEPIGIMKDTLQITALTRNFYRTNSNMWSWVPFFRFSTTRDVGSGDQTYVEYTIPGAGPLKFDCELNQRGNGFECGGQSIPDDKTSIYTGPVNFAIKMRNELQGTNSTLLTGRMKVAKVRSNSGGPKAANEWVYYVDQDWNMPIGYIFYTPNKGVHGWDYPTFNVAFWVRGEARNIEPHLFYQGKEIGRVFTDGIQMGAASCEAIVENLTTHNGKLENGITPANKLGSGRVIVPVTIIGDLDGQWDRAAWKTEAFYGNPLTGFTAAP